MKLRKTLFTVSSMLILATVSGLALQPALAATTSSTKIPAAKTKAVKQVKAVKQPKAQKAKVRTAKNTHPTKAQRAAKKTVRVAIPRVYRRGPSAAALAGLRGMQDPLGLSSSAAFMVNSATGEVLFQKNADAQLPIASLTKLMTALVVVEAGLPMDEKLVVSRADYVSSRAASKLRAGMTMTRETTLLAALMSSDNRAAHMLGRTYPGGIDAFVAAMNAKAAALGMTGSQFADPTGLDNNNLSTARDLSRLVEAAERHPVLRQVSTTPKAELAAGRSLLSMHSTNRLVSNPDWDIALQKTGLTTAAGFCMAMQTNIEGEDMVLVVLDSRSGAQRVADMEKMRSWYMEHAGFSRQFQHLSPYALL